MICVSVKVSHWVGNESVNFKFDFILFQNINNKKLYTALKNTSTLHVSTAKMVRNCSFCGQVGHNKATCGFREISMICLDEESTRRCSYCACSGHDMRNCLAHQQLIWFNPENEQIKTPQTPSIPPTHTTPFQPTPKDISSIKRRITFSTPLKMSDIPTTRRRAPKILPLTNRARQVTQVIDYNVYDEPWVWAPPRPIHRTSVTQPTPHNIIFT